jgi:hypothetical protein
MKNLTKSLAFLMLPIAILSFGGCSASKKAATSSGTASQPIPATVITGSHLGTWTFTVTGTPDGDTKGEMIISQAGNVLKGIISSGSGQSEIKDLKIVNNVLTGLFDFNGMSINMTGTFNGNSYEGKVEAQGYTFPMTAAKK